MIINPQKQAIASTLTLEDFGRAMAAIDWSAIPEHKRNRAMAARLLTLMIQTSPDATLASRTPLILPK